MSTGMSDFELAMYSSEAAESTGENPALLAIQIPKIGPESTRPGNDSHAKTLLLDQERFLPIANVVRIMKSQIPARGMIAKDAKQLLQECASEFISFVTSEACDACIMQRRRSITSEDLIGAMERLGFHSYVEPLRIFLHRYRFARRFKLSPTSVRNRDVHGSVLPDHEGGEYSFMDNENFTRMDDTEYMSDEDANRLPTVFPEEFSKADNCVNTTIDNAQGEVHMENQNVSVQTTVPLMANLGGSSEEVHLGQLFMDPVSNQYYIVVDAANGQKAFLPVDLKQIEGIISSIPMNISDAKDQDAIP